MDCGMWVLKIVSKMLPCYFELSYCQCGPEGDIPLHRRHWTHRLHVFITQNITLWISTAVQSPRLLWLLGTVFLRRCATSRKVPGSIPGGVTGFFSEIPSDRTMVLGSTQPLVKMNTRNIPGSKGGRCVRLTTSPHSSAECYEIWEPKPPTTLWATPGLLRDSFTLGTVFLNFPMVSLVFFSDIILPVALWPSGRISL